MSNNGFRGNKLTRYLFGDNAGTIATRTINGQCDFSRPFRHPIFMTIPPGTAP